MRRFLCALGGHIIRGSSCNCGDHRRRVFRNYTYVPGFIDAPSWTRDERFGAEWYQPEVNGLGFSIVSPYLVKEGRL